MNISVPPQTGCWPLPGHPYDIILNIYIKYCIQTSDQGYYSELKPTKKLIFFKMIFYWNKIK